MQTSPQSKDVLPLSAAEISRIELGPLPLVLPTLHRMRVRRTQQLDRALKEEAKSKVKAENLEAALNEPLRELEQLVQLQGTRFMVAAWRATRFKITGKKRAKDALRFPAYQLVDYIHRAWEKAGFPDGGVPIKQDRLAKIASGIGTRHVRRLISGISPIVEIVHSGNHESSYLVHLVEDDECRALWQERVRVAYLCFLVGWCGSE